MAQVTRPIAAAPETDLIRYAAHIAQNINAEWSRHDHDEATFSAIARAVLERMEPHLHVDIEHALPLLAQGTYPEQTDTARVDGPLAMCSVTVFEDRRMQIDLNAWFVGPMIVHDHNYHAAFAVLRGESFEERFEWRQEVATPEGLATGTLVKQGTRWLTAGDVSEVAPFDGCVHRVWHMSVPSASFFVNTRAPGGVQGGRSFDESGLAFPYPLVRTLSVPDMKRLHIFEASLRNGFSNSVEVLRAALRDATPLTLFHALQRLLVLPATQTHWQALDDLAETALPGLGARFARYRDRVARWNEVDWKQNLARDEMIALAALMSANDSRELKAFLAGTPLRDTQTMIPALASAQQKAALVSPLPELAFDVMQDVVTGQGDAAIHARLSDLYGRESVTALEAEIAAMVRQMRASPLLACAAQRV